MFRCGFGWISPKQETTTHCTPNDSKPPLFDSSMLYHWCLWCSICLFGFLFLSALAVKFQRKYHAMKSVELPFFWPASSFISPSHSLVSHTFARLRSLFFVHPRPRLSYPIPIPIGACHVFSHSFITFANPESADARFFLVLRCGAFVCSLHTRIIQQDGERMV